MKRLFKGFIIAVLALVFLMLTSCLGTKQTTEKNSVSNTTENKQVDNTKQTDIATNRPIDDKFNIPIRSNDEAVNTAIRNAFRDFGYTKQSGTNSTQMSFDPDAMAFKIANYIGQTQDKSTVVKTDNTSTKTSNTVKEDAFYKKIQVIPWYIYVAAAIFFLPNILKIISPAYAIIQKVISDLKTRHNTDNNNV